NIEVKNYSGKVIATPKGLYNKGKKQDSVVRQAWRQSHKLRELLAVEVVPILVFVSDGLEGNRVGRLHVMRPNELVPYFKSLSRCWEHSQFLEVVQKAEKLVK
ncbi:MAG: nuclease, partial [Meiothermus sp.]